jgi:hypothetical protein
MELISNDQRNRTDLAPDKNIKLFEDLIFTDRLKVIRTPIEDLIYNITCDLKSKYVVRRYKKTGSIEGDNVALWKILYQNIRLCLIDFLLMSYRSLHELFDILDNIDYELGDLRTLYTKQPPNDIKNDIMRLINLSREKARFLLHKVLVGITNEQSKYREETSELSVSTLSEQSKGLLDVCFDQYLNSGDLNLKSNSLKSIINDFNSGLSIEKYNNLHYLVKCFRQNGIKHPAENLKKLNSITVPGIQQSVTNSLIVEFNTVALDSANAFLACAKYDLELRSNYGILPSFSNDKLKTSNDLTRNFFYHYRSYCNYCASLCSVNEITLEELRSILSSWSQAHQEWKNNLLEAQKNNFHAFFLPFNESCLLLLTENETPLGNDLPVFIASSYVIPFNYEDLQNELIVNKRSLIGAQQRLVEVAEKKILSVAQNSAEKIAEKTAGKTAVETAEKIAVEKAESKASEIALKTIKDSELKAMQVISVFVALVAFAGNSIVAGKHLNSFPSALMFLGIMGFSLFMFVYTLLYHLRIMNSNEKNSGEGESPSGEMKKWNTSIWVFSLLFIGLIIAGAIWLNKSPQNDTSTADAPIRQEFNISPK